jgi:hypothetical protein
MDRRSGIDRRGRAERRQGNVAVAVERRSGMDRRSGVDRRDEARRVPGERREEPPDLPS